MDPITAGIAANVGGGLVGNLVGSNDRNAANNLLSDIYNQYKNLQTPTIQSMEINPAQYQSSGSLNPALEQTAQLGATDAYQNINLDPRLQKTQQDNLAMLQKVANQGFTDTDRAALQLALNESNANQTARTKAMLQQQDARGVGSSDAALALRAQDAQSQANRDSQAALQQAVEGRNRALQAATQGSSMAAQMQNADYQRQANLANALNQRQLTNTELQAQTQARNVASQNAAQQFNLQNAQNITNANTTTSNTAQQYNKQLNQQNYQNQLAKLAGATGAGNTLAGNYMNNANATGAMFSNIGSGIGKIAGAQAANNGTTKNWWE